MSELRYRVIGTSGSEIGVVTDERTEIAEGDPVRLPNGATALVIEVYDDEHGQDGGVVATLVVDEDVAP